MCASLFSLLIVGSIVPSACVLQVVPIRDASVRSRIQQNFRITYLKDAVLLRQLDDATLASLAHTLFFNNMHIVNTLIDDADFLRDLFTMMLHMPEMSAGGVAPVASDGMRVLMNTASYQTSFFVMVAWLGFQFVVLRL